MGDTQVFLFAILAAFGGGSVLASHSGEPVLRDDLVPAAQSEMIDPGNDRVAGPLTIRRAEDGLFYLDGAIGRETVRFLVDTGANLTVLSPEDAGRVGVEGRAGNIALATANGTARIAEARVRRLELAGHSLSNVRIGIAPDGLPVSLLGQDALSRMGTITIEGDVLTMHGPHG
jgi:aspartyl protease family protein